MSGEDDITRKLRKMMAMGATPEHGLIVVRWHYISTMEEWRNDVDLCADAANEIERLREQLRLCNIDNFNTTAERDEARRHCCEYAAIVAKADTVKAMESGRFHEVKIKHMRDMGWDCFKEEK
jgi:hypothetical protein